MDDTKEELLLVDETDVEISTARKLETHRRGDLHRAFSVFLFNDAGETLLQQRASVKYHSRGLWANTCCGHPRPGEPVASAARRRLGEELGIDAELTFAFTARYRAELDNDMIENEFVHVFHGKATAPARPDPCEVSAVRFMSLAELEADTVARPHAYAVWLKHYVGNHSDALHAVARRSRRT